MTFCFEIISIYILYQCKDEIFFIKLHYMHTWRFSTATKVLSANCNTNSVCFSDSYGK